MDLIPWRAACSILPRNALSILAVAIAALLPLEPGAFAQEELPTQSKITEALWRRAR